jgi:UDP-sulfoquinovose synthase
MLNVADTVECIRLAAEHPAEPGEFRVFNQFTEQMSVTEVATRVAEAYQGPCTIEQVPNPRVESELHYYRAAHTRLLDLGLVPHLVDDNLIASLFAIVERHKDRVNLDAIRPSIHWRSTASELAAAG